MERQEKRNVDLRPNDNGIINISSSINYEFEQKIVQSSEQVLSIINDVKRMIEEAKKNGTFNLRRFVEHPYQGFNTGFRIVKKLSLGNEKNFVSILKTLSSLDEPDKDEISAVLWVFRGLQEEETMRRNERRLEEALGLKKAPYPYTNHENEYDEILEDSEVKEDLFHYVNELNESSIDEALHDVLVEGIGSLSDKQRLIATKILIEGYKPVEVARELKISKSTVSITFERAKKNLIKKIKA